MSKPLVFKLKNADVRVLFDLYFHTEPQGPGTRHFAAWVRDITGVSFRDITRDDMVRDYQDGRFSDYDYIVECESNAEFVEFKLKWL